MRTPWYRKQTHSWYVEIVGVQHNLGKHPFREPPTKGKKGWNPPKPIEDAWKALKPDEEKEDKSDGRTIDEVIALYLASLEGCAVKTRRNAKEYLTNFSKAVGGSLPVSQFKKHQLTAYLKSKNWSESNKATFWSKLFACLNHAVEEQYIPALPFRPKRGEKPKFARRTLVLTEKQMDRIEAGVDDNFRAFLRVLRDTGCRPIELATLTIEACDLKKGVALVLNKTRKKTGVEFRPVYLTRRSIDVIREVIRGRTNGWVFLNSRGKPWASNILSHKMRDTRLRLKMGPECVLYSYRHGLASRAINSGDVNPALVARLLGHSDLKMLLRTYLHDDEKAMRQAAERAAGKS